MKAAFDCDGTLITFGGDPNYPVIDLFHALEKLGVEMYIWSGGGNDYAERIARRLGLKATIVTKGSFKPDLAIDDQTASLGISNILLPNHISEGKEHGY